MLQHKDSHRVLAIKTFVLTVLFLFISLSQHAQQREPDSTRYFTGTFQELLAEADKQGKTAMVYTTAEWCAPCKEMEKSVFPVDSVVRFRNRHFINYKVDVQKGEGPAIQKKLNVGLPGYTFFDEKGAIVYQFVGYNEPPDFLHKCRDALHPEKTPLYRMQQAYSAGARDKAFLKDYLSVLSEHNSPDTKNIYRELMDQYQDREYESKEAWEWMQRYISDDESPEYRYVAMNRKRFASLYGEDAVNGVITRGILGQMQQAMTRNDSLTFFKKARLLEEKGGKEGAYLAAQTILDFYIYTSRHKDFLKAASDPEMQESFKGKAAYYTQLSVMVALKRIPELLEPALEWNQEAMALKGENVQDLMIRGELYDAMDHKNEALDLFEQALALYKKESPDGEPMGILNRIHDLKQEKQLK